MLCVDFELYPGFSKDAYTLTLLGIELPGGAVFEVPILSFVIDVCCVHGGKHIGDTIVCNQVNGRYSCNESSLK